MKKTYEQPLMKIQIFEADEYVASCMAFANKDGSYQFKNLGFTPTFGQNKDILGFRTFDGLGFADDGFDQLDSPTFDKAGNGWYCNDTASLGLDTSKLQTEMVSKWEANKLEHFSGSVKSWRHYVDYVATPCIEITGANAKRFGCDNVANAS